MTDPRGDREIPPDRLSAGGGARVTGGECPVCGQEFDHSLAIHLPKCPVLAEGANSDD